MSTYQRWYNLNGVWEVWGVRGVLWGEGIPHGTTLTKLGLCMPPCILCDMGVGHWGGVVVVLSYLNHSDGGSWSASSHMWGSWYLPRFLLGDGSLTQMCIAFLIVLVTPCDSLPIMVKHSSLTRCPLVWLWWCIGDGALRCFFNLFLNDLPNSPIYASWQLLHWH